MTSTPYQANLSSAFDDTYTPSTAIDGEVDGSAMYRRLQQPSKKPMWIAPVVGLAIVAAGAAIFLVKPAGDQATVPNVASTTTTTRTAALNTPARAPLQQASAPAPSVATAQPAPIRTARATPAPRAQTEAPTESLTAAPVAEAPAAAPAASEAASETVVPSTTSVNPLPEAPTAAPVEPAPAAVQAPVAEPTAPAPAAAAPTTIAEASAE